MKYPNITVELVGRDGNVFAILGACNRAMSRAGLTPVQREEFITEATAGDYDHVLRTVMNYFNVE
jgi:hypothetical protein